MHTLLQAGFCAALLTVSSAWAGELSPVGLWKNIDDVSGKPRALIRITENHGELQGRIEKLFLEPGQDQHPNCGHCKGEHKDQPVVGMVLMWGLKKSGDDYGGGEILDPDDGKVYKSKITLIDGGRKLSVRGYIGIPMLGRSQVWLRQP